MRATGFPILSAMQTWCLGYSMELQQLSSWLNESALPRAIADFEGQRFITWNRAFLERTGYSEDRIKVIKPEDIIVLGNLRFPLLSGGGRLSAECTTCAIRTTLQPAALPGHIMKSVGGLGYLILHATDSFASDEFDQGRLVGQEEERARVVQVFHDDVSSTMIAALFAIESVRNALEAQDLPQAESLAKAPELISEAVEKIGDVLEAKKVKKGNRRETRNKLVFRS